MKRWSLWHKKWTLLRRGLLGNWKPFVFTSFFLVETLAANTYMPTNFALGKSRSATTLLPSSSVVGWLDWSANRFEPCRFLAGSQQNSRGKLSIPIHFPDIGWRSRIEVDLQVPGALPPKQSGFLRSLCEGSTSHLSNGVVYNQVTDWLARWYPNFTCQPEPGVGWNCLLPSKYSLSHAKRVLNSLESRTLKRWVRQPYLVLRNLAVSHQLVAENIETNSSSSRRAARAPFCSSLKRIGQEEIPLVFSDLSWQKSYCEQQEEAKKRPAARIGLAFQTEVLDHLVTLSTLVSVPGRFRLSLPEKITKQFEGQGYLVKMVPQQDVIDKVWQNSHKLWNQKVQSLKEGQELGGVTLSAHCPYPGLSQNGLRRLHLWLGRRDFALGCTMVGGALLEQEIKLQQAKMLVGEAEFLIGNHRRKVLRLPQGTYHYMVYPVPKSQKRWNPDGWTDKPVASGLISWRPGKASLRTVSK